MQTTSDIQAPCGHSFFKIVKHGPRHNKSGDVQRYTCIQCGHRFSFGPQKKKHLTFELWKFVLMLSNQGLSTRKIAKQIQEKFGIEVSHCSVSKWIVQSPEIFKPYPLQIKILEHYQNKLESDMEFCKRELLRLDAKKEVIYNRMNDTKSRLSNTNKEMKDLEARSVLL